MQEKTIHVKHSMFRNIASGGIKSFEKSEKDGEPTNPEHLYHIFLKILTIGSISANKNMEWKFGDFH